MELLGLSEEELCTILAVDPLTLLSGQVDHVGELPILHALVAQAAEQAGGPVLRRWVRASGPVARPIELLLKRNFTKFEEALADLGERGFVVRRDGDG